MIKIVFFIIVPSTIGYYLYRRWYAKHLLFIERLATAPLRPKNTIVVFDIHGVLFKHNYQAMLKKAFHGGAFFKLIPHTLSIRFIKDFLSLVFRNALAEEFIIGLAGRHPGIKQFIPLGIEIANSQTINEPVIALAQELKDRGYQLHILSNIGSVIFEDLYKKHPTIFSLFDGIKVANAQELYLGKPNRKMFNNYQIQLNKENKLIVFIDDKTRNIKAARAQTMISVYACCNYHLYKKLQLLGLIW